MLMNFLDFIDIFLISFFIYFYGKENLCLFGVILK